jgi:glycosyltransferase involved in cell wall biosynthesis/SAM-dependent methyltransferase
MRVLIDGQTLRTPEINRGIGKYFVNTVESILHTDFINEFFISAQATTDLAPFSAWARDKLRFVECGADTNSGGNFDERSSSYSDRTNDVISTMGIDLYWSPNALMDSVFLPARKVDDCRYAVTIFDLIPLVMEDHFKQAWPPKIFARYRKKLALLETDYDLFFHISRHTYTDFTSRLAVTQKSHVVTPLAVADSFRPYPFPKIPEAEDYVLYPGGFDPRKNMIGALAAFAELHERYGDDPTVRGTRLRLVCHINAAAENDIRKQAKRLGVADKVDLTGFVTDEELIRLYQKARCLFFPSLYEGFGLPVLEGLACGLPVAASNTSAIPEVARDLAIYFDPSDVKDMAQALYRALNEPVDIESRRRRHQYSKTFTWQETAMTTLNGFANCVEPPAEVNADTSSEDNQPELIDVRKLLAELSVAELCETAEQFFKRLETWDYLHAKPFAAIEETPELLIGFAHVVQGLKLLPDMTILDFGAGSCWTSRFLSQMGLKVIAHDVSASALRIGKALYERQPVIGNQPEASFLHFDGERIDLPDASVDRISCWDAFHHVPNQAQVLKEMGRILKPGGIAGFSEPGPDHSKTPQAQYEMRTNRVIENDIDVREILTIAKEAGFTEK